MTLKRREYSSDLGGGGYTKLRGERIGERTRENQIMKLSRPALAGGKERC